MRVKSSVIILTWLCQNIGRTQICFVKGKVYFSTLQACLIVIVFVLKCNWRIMWKSRSSSSWKWISNVMILALCNTGGTYSSLMNFWHLWCSGKLIFNLHANSRHVRSHFHNNHSFLCGIIILRFSINKNKPQK